jgi:hypothetical protein
MLKRALPIVVMFASTIVFAASPAPPTGSSATVTPVPNITFGQTLLSDPPASAAKALTASNAQPGSASAAKPEVQAAAPAEHAAAGKTEPNEYMSVGSGRSVKITDALLILFTAILAIFTGGLWVSTRALWKETKRGGRTAETAANAAEKSALAAETSADASLISVEASIAAQQPRWLVEAMTVHSRLNYPSTSTARNITVTMANHGSTSAEITRTELRYGVLENLPADPEQARHTHGINLLGTGTDVTKFGHITKSGETFYIHEQLNLDDQQLVALTSKSLRLWSFGTFQYRDYLDRTWEKGFVAVLDTERADLSPGDNLGQGSNSAFVQPPPDAGVQAYTYTRRVT